MAKVFLLLGSNTGNSRSILTRTSEEIEQKVGKISNSSSIYLTEPWGLKEQPAFLNQLLIVETTLPPLDLLNTTLGIEQNQGRERMEKYGPRTLDIDIIYYGQEIVVKPGLKIPHPEIQNRRFVLIPLTELEPDFRHPVLNLTNKELLERCKDALAVEKV